MFHLPPFFRKSFRCPILPWMSIETGYYTLMRILRTIPTPPLAVADQIKTSTMSIHNPLLRSLLSMLPAFLLYTSSTDTLRVVDLSPREIDDYKSAILDNNGTLNIEKANANLSRWNERTTILRQVHSKNESYFQLVQLLTGKIDFTKLDAEAYCQLYSIRDAELDYMIHARATFTELKRIHDDFNSKNADIEKTASAYDAAAAKVTDKKASCRKRWTIAAKPISLSRSIVQSERASRNSMPHMKRLLSSTTPPNFSRTSWAHRGSFRSVKRLLQRSSLSFLRKMGATTIPARKAADCMS